MKKRIRCQICGDIVPDARPRDRHTCICEDCQQRNAQPPEGAQVAREFTCADCETRFILATGELVAHRDTRFCLTCWHLRRYTTRIVSAPRYEQPAPKQKPDYVPAPEWAVELGLNWPCTPDDVERRGRELAKNTHPDLGGDHAMFIIKRDYLEQARAYFAQQAEQAVLL